MGNFFYQNDPYKWEGIFPGGPLDWQEGVSGFSMDIQNVS